LSRHIFAPRGERPQDGPKGEAKGRVKESQQRKGDDGVGFALSKYEAQRH
jgi:hypothetical protein